MVRLGQNKNSLIKSFDIHLKSDRVSLGTSGIDSFQGLLDFSIDRIFGRRNNNIEESFQMIILINNIIADKNFVTHTFGTYEMDFYGLNYEQITYCDYKYTYFERWGVCTRITTVEFLSIFLEMHAFLLRYNRRQVIELIYSIFLDLKSGNLDSEIWNVRNINEKDNIVFILNQESLAMEFDDFIKKLEFPTHLAE